MPIEDRFDFLDLMFFFKITKRLIPVKLPPYLSLYQMNSRIRTTHLDSLSYISSITPSAATNSFAQGFFFRTHVKWNHIPFEIKSANNVSDFHNLLSKHMWENILSRNANESSDNDSDWE